MHITEFCRRGNSRQVRGNDARPVHNNRLLHTDGYGRGNSRHVRGNSRHVRGNAIRL